MGHFVLKTGEDYVVPEALRVNAQKKRRQLVLLDEVNVIYLQKYRDIDIDIDTDR